MQRIVKVDGYPGVENLVSELWQLKLEALDSSLDNYQPFTFLDFSFTHCTILVLVLPNWRKICEMKARH